MVTFYHDRDGGPPLGVCLRDDEKPTVGIANGTVLIEMDSDSDFAFDEENARWIPQQ